MRAAVAFALLFLALARAHAAQGPLSVGFSARVWRTEHGLPHRQIRDLHQTRDGYIWAVTPAGMVRFDGHDFDVFNRTTHPQLPDEDFYALAETRDGALWAASAGALIRWQDGKLSVFSEITGVRAVSAAPEGALIAATTNGVVRFDGAKFQRFGADHGLTGLDIRFAAEDREGSIWAAPEHWMYEGAINRMRRGTARFEIVGSAGLDEMTHWMEVDSEGVFWWGDNVGAHAMLPAGRRDFFRFEPGASTVVSHLKRARAGVLAVISPRSEYKGRAGVFLVTTNSAERIDVPELDQPTVAIQDFEDAFWVGTREDGLWQLQRKAVATWRVQEGLIDDYVAAVVPSSDGVIALTARAATLIPSMIDVTPPDYFSGSDATIMRRLPTHAGLIAVNPRGQVHISHGAGWRDESEQAGFFAHKSTPAKTRERFNAHCLAEAPDGLFLARSDRLAFRTQNGAWITNVVNAPSGIATMRAARDATLWIGAAGKLHELKYLISNNTLILRSQRVLSTPSPQSTKILFIEISAEGAIWLATDRGLGLADQDQIRLLSANNGLPTDTIYSVLEDDRRGVWIGSNRGLIHAEKEDLLGAFRDGSRAQFVLVREAEGMPTSETMGGSDAVACRTPDGHLWFATAKGLVEVDPKRDVHNRFRPCVLVEAAFIDDLPATNGVALGPGRGRTVEFRFTGTSLADPSRARFRYILEGVDKSWREESRRDAVYTLLGAGNYTFKVIALNNHGAPSLEPATFRFSIAPYFWQTTQFRLACAAAIALIAIAWHRSRLTVGRRIQALEHERELQSERARIARDMHDDLGAGLARVALLSDLAARDHEAPPTKQLRTISRQLIRSLDEIVWAVHPGKDNSEELISYLGDTAQEFLAGSPVSLRLQLPEAGDTIHVPSRVRHSLVMALKEALHNVMKHSGAKNVTVHLKLENGDFFMEVADDGQGLPSNGRNGDGLGNMRERLASVGGTLEIESTPQGVRLLAIAPLSRWQHLN